MATPAQKVRLAIFLISACGVLALFLLFVAGRHLLKPRDHYFIDFSASVGGLTKGNTVKYQGITVGRVENTSISPEDLVTVVVEISVARDKVSDAIRADTQARLHGQGITGLKYIELVAGSPASEVLPPGSHIRASSTFLSNLDERAEALTAKVEILLDNMTHLTNRQNSVELGRLLSTGAEFMDGASGLVNDNRDPIGNTFKNLESMTHSLAGTASTLQATMDSLHQMMTSDDMHSTLGDLQLATRAGRELLEGPLPDLLENVSRMAGTIDTTFTHVDRTVIQSRRNILAAMQNLEETLQNINTATELIRENPSILIRGRAEE